MDQKVLSNFFEFFHFGFFDFSPSILGLKGSNLVEVMPFSELYISFLRCIAIARAVLEKSRFFDFFGFFSFFQLFSTNPWPFHEIIQPTSAYSNSPFIALAIIFTRSVLVELLDFKETQKSQKVSKITPDSDAETSISSEK